MVCIVQLDLFLLICHRYLEIRKKNVDVRNTVRMNGIVGPALHLVLVYMAGTWLQHMSVAGTSRSSGAKKGGWLAASATRLVRT